MSTPDHSKIFSTLNHVLSQKKLSVVFEQRPRKFMCSTTNYGEIPGMYNAADGDPWDVFTPGQTRRLQRGTPYKVKRILGVVKVENGNHKIAVELYVPGFCTDLVEDAVHEYRRLYTRLTRKQTEWSPM